MYGLTFEQAMRVDLLYRMDMLIGQIIEVVHNLNNLMILLPLSIYHF